MCCEIGTCEVSSSTDCIDISDLPGGSNAMILLPHSDASRFRAIVWQIPSPLGVVLINF